MWLTVQVAGQTSPFFPPSLQAQGEKCYFFKSSIWETQQPCNCEGKGRTTCQTKHLRGNLKYCKQWSNPLTVETGTCWGERGGVWAHGVKEKCFQIHKRELWQQLGIAFNTPTERAPLFLKTSSFKMNISLLAKFARAFFIPTPATPPTPQPPTVNGVYGHQWPSFMCWQDVFLSLSNQRGGIIIPGQPHVPVLLTRVYWGWKHWNAVWVQCNSAVLLVLSAHPSPTPPSSLSSLFFSSSPWKKIKKSLGTN